MPRGSSASPRSSSAGAAGSPSDPTTRNGLRISKSTSENSNMRRRPPELRGNRTGELLGQLHRAVLGICLYWQACSLPRPLRLASRNASADPIIIFQHAQRRIAIESNPERRVGGNVPTQWPKFAYGYGPTFRDRIGQL